MPVQVNGEVLSLRKIGAYYAMTVVAPGVAEVAKPGQFVTFAVGGISGVMLGMVIVALIVSGIGGARFGSLRAWTVGGCAASACALFGLAVAAFVGPAWPLRASVLVLGIANGAYSIAAIGSMMALVASGHASREGVRMGLWGAATIEHHFWSEGYEVGPNPGVLNAYWAAITTIVVKSGRKIC